MDKGLINDKSADCALGRDRLPLRIKPIVENMHSTSTDEALLVRITLASCFKWSRRQDLLRSSRRSADHRQHHHQPSPVGMHLLQYYAMLQQKSLSFADWLQLINVHPLLFLNCHAVLLSSSEPTAACSEDATAGLEVDVPDTTAASGNRDGSCQLAEGFMIIHIHNTHYT